MKKNLFLMAAAALAFAACTSEDLSINDEKQVAQAGNVPVAFDTYISSNTNGTTRSAYDGNYAGYGAYTNDELQGGGFGVFASYYDGSDKYADLTTAPKYNFMYNQLVEYSGGNWTYEPLLYWPNETSKNSTADAQTDQQTGNTATAPHLDRVSFFAYAPYVKLKGTGTSGLNPVDGSIWDTTEKDTDDDFGNVLMPAVDETKVPFIKYNVATTPAESEDLLWAVAPYGGLKYTAVNGDQIDVAYGNSFVDLVKPAVNTKIKFLFQHALAALKMSIVAAIDEVEPKGTTDLNDNTKIFVNKITIKSNSADNGFATKGTLSLLNRSNGLEPNLPNWSNLTENATAGNTSLIISAIDGAGPDLLNDADIQLNPELCSGLDIIGGDEYTDTGWSFDSAKEGVNQDEKGVFVENDGFGKDLIMFIPKLKDDYKYNTASDLSVTVTIDYDVVTKGSNVDGGFVVVNNKISKVISLPKYRNGRIYKLKLILGMTSVQLEAEASDWTEVGQEVDLPRNLD
jgi:hypothetical protein